MTRRRRFSADFKAEVALQALRGELTLAQLSRKYQVHPTMISTWKRQLTQEATQLFTRGRSSSERASEDRIKELHAKIGQLTIEKDFLKKGLAL